MSVTPPEHRRSGTDLRLVPAAVSVYVVAWLVPLGRGALLGCAVAIACAGLLGRAWRVTRPVPARVIAAACCAAVASLASAALLTHTVHTGPVTDLAREAAVAQLDVTVATDPVRRASRFDPAGYVTARVVATRVSARGTTSAVHVPVLLTASAHGAAEALEAARPGERFHVTARLASVPRSDDIAAIGALRGTPMRFAPAGRVDRLAEHLRAGLRRASAGLPGDARALVPALVVGDVSGVDPGLDAAFKATGLTHLAAVSGTNLAILLSLVLAVARPLGVRGRSAVVLGLLTTVFFVVLARPEPSVIRAAAMGLVVVVGMALGCRRAGVPALAIAVIVLVLGWPSLARTYGFALSALATAGLLLLAPRLAAAMRPWAGEAVATVIAVPVAAHLVTVPVIVALSGTVSLAAIPANLLAEPAVAPVTIAGVIAALVAPLSGVAAAGVGWMGAAPAAWIAWVARTGASAPGAQVEVSGRVVGVLAMTVLSAVAVAALPRMLASRRGFAALSVVLVVFLAIGTWPVLRPVLRLGAHVTGWPPADWHIAACDVGQGDGLAVRTGADSALVIDTGPEPGPMRRCLDMLGITVVPLLVLTHFHADHVGGVDGVLAGRTVGAALVTRTTAVDAVGRRALDTLAAAHVPVDVATVGTHRRIGDAEWTTLWCAAAAGGTREGSAGSDESVENDSSVVARIEVAGLSMLATGDVEPAVQARLLASYGSALAVDVLKTPHHGSRYQDAAFLAAAHARVALVSVGEDNDYGHPSPQTVATLTGDGAMVVRTDLAGTAVVAGDDAGLRVVRR